MERKVKVICIVSVYECCNDKCRYFNHENGVCYSCKSKKLEKQTYRSTIIKKRKVEK